MTMLTSPGRPGPGKKRLWVCNSGPPVGPLLASWTAGKPRAQGNRLLLRAYQHQVRGPGVGTQLFRGQPATFPAASSDGCPARYSIWPGPSALQRGDYPAANMSTAK